MFHRTQSCCHLVDCSKTTELKSSHFAIKTNSCLKILIFNIGLQLNMLHYPLSWLHYIKCISSYRIIFEDALLIISSKEIFSITCLNSKGGERIVDSKTIHIGCNVSKLTLKCQVHGLPNTHNKSLRTRKLKGHQRHIAHNRKSLCWDIITGRYLSSLSLESWLALGLFRIIKMPGYYGIIIVFTG